MNRGQKLLCHVPCFRTEWGILGSSVSYIHSDGVGEIAAEASITANGERQEHTAQRRWELGIKCENEAGDTYCRFSFNYIPFRINWEYRRLDGKNRFEH